MAKVAIVTDSTAFMPTEFTRHLPIFFIPLHVIWGDETFLDNVDITADQFYEKLKTSKVLPSTSQPSPAAFQDLYLKLIDQGYDILSIHISARLSGTIDSAIQARNMLPNMQIEILDSETTSLAMGFHVLAAARLAAQGATLHECKIEAEQARSHCGVLFVLNTLEFLRRGGRIGGGAAFLGTMLNLKPILEIRGGRVEAVERVRTSTKARDRMIDLFVSKVAAERCPIRIATMHADTPEDAALLLEKARQRFGITDVAETIIGNVSPVLGVHTGNGALGVAWMAGM
jgi:DegV family protein with EDD domain